MQLTEEEAHRLWEIQQTNKFMRGAMMFEDFNYKLFNKYILIDQENKDYEYLYEPDINLESEG